MRKVPATIEVGIHSYTVATGRWLCGGVDKSSSDTRVKRA
jgi:hypothetical protein